MGVGKIIYRNLPHFFRIFYAFFLASVRPHNAPPGGSVHRSRALASGAHSSAGPPPVFWSRKIFLMFFFAENYEKKPLEHPSHHSFWVQWSTFHPQMRYFVRPPSLKAQFKPFMKDFAAKMGILQSFWWFLLKNMKRIPQNPLPTIFSHFNSWQFHPNSDFLPRPTSPRPN